MSEVKRLYKSKDKKVSGVCGGLAEYFDTDPTLFRVLFALLIIFTGLFPGLIAYIVLAVIMPEKPAETSNKKEKK